MNVFKKFMGYNNCSLVQLGFYIKFVIVQSHLATRQLWSTSDGDTGTELWGNRSRFRTIPWGLRRDAQRGWRSKYHKIVELILIETETCHRFRQKGSLCLMSARRLVGERSYRNKFTNEPSFIQCCTCISFCNIWRERFFLTVTTWQQLKYIQSKSFCQEKGKGYFTVWNNYYRNVNKYINQYAFGNAFENWFPTLCIVKRNGDSLHVYNWKHK